MRLDLKHLTPREILIRKRMQGRKKVKRYNERNVEKVLERRRISQAVRRKEKPDECRAAVEAAKAKKPDHYRSLAAAGKRRRYQQDPETHLSKSRQRKKKCKAAIRKGNDKWNAENRPAMLLSKRKSGAKAAESLADHYIAKRLHLPIERLRNHPDGPEIIEAKREQIAALRKLSPKKPRTKKHAQESTNNKGNP